MSYPINHCQDQCQGASPGQGTQVSGRAPAWQESDLKLIPCTGIEEKEGEEGRRRKRKNGGGWGEREKSIMIPVSRRLKRED